VLRIDAKPQPLETPAARNCLWCKADAAQQITEAEGELTL